MDEPGGVPEHLDRTPPDRVNKVAWRRMNAAQREGYLRWLREWRDGMDEERRAKRRHRHGY